MLKQTATARRIQPEADASAGGSVHPRPSVNDFEDRAWRDGTENVWALCKRTIAQAEGDLVRFGCAFAILDLITGLSACFAPSLTSLLQIARLAGLVILVPALLRALAIGHATRPDSDLLKAIAIAIGVGALYVALRTSVVVRVCSL
jgi:hypothetical protein